ncbi:MAG: MATE family efflux transporter [Clostridia bacterium]|nr:MATE family efflux transporter [Clostridia bacterium]
MTIKLSDQFTYQKLLRFTFPSIMMMIFTSIYGVVDGFFVSNFVGKTPFAAVNFIMPFLMILGSLGFMFGTGGSALIAKTLGEGDSKKANSTFSMLIYVSLLTGILIGALGILLLRPVAMLMGAEGQLLEDCVLYGQIYLLATPALILQFEFQSFFVTAEKPQLGLFVIVAAGCTNMLLDALLTAVIPLGLAGAAAATAISQVIGGCVPLLYFSRKNSSLLRLGKAHLDGRALIRTCANGSSELMSNLSMSLVGMLYNIQLMDYAGENGVAAYGVMMYVSMIFIAIFIGFSTGSAPIVSYHYGAGNHRELQGLRKKSMVIIGVSSLGMFLLAEGMAGILSGIFVGYDPALYDMTLHGFRIFSFSFLFAGIAIFGSSFFTALNNGLISALISFLRTLLFQTAAVLLLPLIWKTDGIWLSLVAAEVVSVLVTVAFLAAKKRTYHY